MEPSEFEVFDDNAYERKKREVLLCKYRGLPRTIRLRDILVLLVIFGLFFRFARWVKLPGEIVVHGIGVLLAVILSQLLLFRRERSVSAMIFGGGVYGIIVALWHLPDDSRWQATFVGWPMFYGIGSLCGTCCGFGLNELLWQLTPKDEQLDSFVISETIAATSNSAEASLGSRDRSRLVNPVSPSNWEKWLLLACELFAAGLLGLGFITFLGSLDGLKFAGTTWSLLVGWLMFTSVVVKSGRIDHHAPMSVAHLPDRGGRMLALTVVLPCLISYVHSLLLTTFSSPSQTPEEGLFFPEICNLIGVLVITTIAYGLGSMTAYFVEDAVSGIAASMRPLQHATSPCDPGSHD